MDDWTLLRQYAREGSEEAFAELVTRHVSMVYSAALRAARQPGLAQEITQKTFCLLAQKAATLSERGLLVGWLYRAACNLSRETLRAETRRRVREDHAARMRPLHADPAPDSPWEEVSPLLDEVIETLPDPEKLAILLRFFQGKPMRDVALAFGITETAARMRVGRALEKLRALFAKRGIKVATITLATWLEERSNASIPGTLIPSLKKIPSHSATLVTSVSLLTKTLIFMAKFSFQKAGALALLGLLGVTITVKTFYHRNPPPPSPPPQSRSTLQLVPSKIPLRFDATKSPTSEIPLTNAIENLKLILSSSWTRKPPLDRLAEALNLFGTNRPAAVPILMSEFTKPRGNRSFTVMSLSMHGLIMLGTNASSALPDLIKLALRGDIAAMNDMVPALFLAVDPTGASVSDLIKGLFSTSGNYNASQIQSTISQLIAANPGSENIYHPLLSNFLTDSNIEVRRLAAFLLAGLPGELDSETIPTLLGCFSLESLRDPKAYEPTVLGSTTTMHDFERDQDENLRNEAINALRAAGPKAQAAIPELLEVAKLLPVTNMFRPFVLETIGTIDPRYRAPSSEVDDRLTLVERGRELTDLAKQRSASFDELVEGLQNPLSVYYAAEALKDLGEDARPALPQLLKSLDQFNDYESAQRIKELDPNLLVEQLKENHLGGLYEIAQALAELGPSATDALPYLNSILNDLKPNDSNIYAVTEAIEKIDPSHPKMLFHSDDLSEAVGAFLNAVNDNNKIQSPVYKAYISDFQDQNNVTRPQLLKFIEATKADPDLHRIFVAKLLEKNPVLAGQINP